MEELICMHQSAPLLPFTLFTMLLTKVSFSSLFFLYSFIIILFYHYNCVYVSFFILYFILLYFSMLILLLGPQNTTFDSIEIFSKYKIGETSDLYDFALRTNDHIYTFEKSYYILGGIDFKKENNSCMTLSIFASFSLSPSFFLWILINFM